jgi:hypothetical protein
MSESDKAQQQPINTMRQKMWCAAFSNACWYLLTPQCLFLAFRNKMVEYAVVWL